MSSLPSSFNLVALVATEDERGRLLSALASRRVEILDEMLTGTRGMVSVAAVMSGDQPVEIFISGAQEQMGLPNLDDVRAALRNLILDGRFQEGAALVLGRRYDHRARHAGDYPELLRRLSADPREPCASTCAGGVAGIGGRPSSLTSTLLWWELARATRKAPDPATVQALRHARKGFSELGAPWQAALASSAHRRAERAMQPSFFDDSAALEIERLRFEVIPALLVQCEATTSEGWALPPRHADASWRYLGRIALDLGDEPELDFGTTPLALRSLRHSWVEGGLIAIEVAADFQARVSFGLKKPSRLERIRYSLYDDGTSEGRSAVAYAGERVILYSESGSLRHQPVLTCTSTLGQLAKFDLVELGVLGRNDKSGDRHAFGAETAAA
ncbi:hypothetical protein [Sphingomonas sp.]|uniref:hypothetical protein n=1 Tax=Sphingomonas sp. TaxID=28214 RepID=UPI002DD69417|nr:hypothetical protein [Sphingomonas sp.]